MAVLSVDNSDKEKGTESSGIPNPASVVRFARDLRSSLAFHRQLGIEKLPVSQGLQLRCRGNERFVQPSINRTKPAEEKLKPPAVKGETESLREIYDHIRKCSGCRAGGGHAPKVPVVDREQIRLMIVGDYCVDKNEQGEPCLFGKAEDVMLGNMVTALGLTMDQVYVTNCIKCFCRPEPLPPHDDPQQCRSFLAREIAALKPPVICAMGELSGRILLGVDKPLIRMRGRFHRYRYYEEYPVEVMVTFHPRFLLAHEEMKRATWGDLLQVKKRFLTEE